MPALRATFRQAAESAATMVCRHPAFTVKTAGRLTLDQCCAMPWTMAHRNDVQRMDEGHAAGEVAAVDDMHAAQPSRFRQVRAQDDLHCLCIVDTCDG